MTFLEHKELTAQDCESVAEILNKLAAAIRGGDLEAFELFWFEGGTEEGAKITMLREQVMLRYYHRRELLATSAENPDTAPSPASP